MESKPSRQPRRDPNESGATRASDPPAPPRPRGSGRERPPPPPRPPSLLRRVVGWAVLVGCGFALAAAVGYAQHWLDYYDRTGDIVERYHSGGTLAAKKVAIIEVSGLIISGEGFAQHQIEKVREDDSVKAIVLRVDSPGGTVSGSDYIYHRLIDLRDEKKLPLVVSMGDMATSGGYYISMAVGDQKDSIFAEPSTTTGSIGVIVPHYDLTGLLKDYNVTDDSVASGDHKQMLSMTRPMSDEERALAQAYVDSAFEQFKGIVKKGRPVFEKDPDALDQLATGEIFWAGTAQKHGLVDKIGFLDDAIDRAIELANLSKDEVRVVYYKKAPSLLDELSVPLGQSRGLFHERALLDERALLELSVPRAYYLFTTLPPLAASGVRRR